ncbi:hypothetical protein HDU82_004611 [Entophlyctis luteolus]|nr:hypothetical protein HDU82_004611 [Entophlyctis luteolus]
MWNIDTADTGATDHSTVAAAVAQAETYVRQNYDPSFNYFPSATWTPDGTGYTYGGHIVLEHESTDAELLLAETFVPFMASRGKKSVYINECDTVLPGASFYLPDNAVLVQFVKNIALPLTAADYAAFNGVFDTTYSNGAAPAVTTTAAAAKTTTTAAAASSTTAAAVSPAASTVTRSSGAASVGSVTRCLRLLFELLTLVVIFF